MGEELIALYDNPDELLKHARVVSLDEIEENEFNLNIALYVDTFEEEPPVDLRVVRDEIAQIETELVAIRASLAKALQELKL